jgi:hypothetical protein
MPISVGGLDRNPKHLLGTTIALHRYGISQVPQEFM